MDEARAHVKLNSFENRINAKELRDYCVRYSPVHMYFSGLNWLFPECARATILKILGKTMNDNENPED